jgi:hypothetical protein
MIRIIIFLILSGLVVSTEARSALAIPVPVYELHIPVGAQLTNPNQLNSILPSGTVVNYVLSFGIDAVADFDGLGVGLRFDSISAFRAGDVGATEVSSRIFSILVHKRSMFGNTYLGPIATYGIYNPSVINVRTDISNWVQYKAGNTSSASIGLETGWILDDVYLVGFEVGYQRLMLQSLVANDGTHLGGTLDVGADFSGPYMKVMAGIHY